MILKICIFGDSIGKGVHLPDNGHYEKVNLNLNKLIGRDDLVINNYSVFGCTITKALSIIRNHASELGEYDSVFLELGGNDCDFNWQEISDAPNAEHECKTPFGVFEETYQSLIDVIRGNGGKPIILTMPPLVAERYFPWISKGKRPENILNWLGSVASIYRWQEMYNLKVVMLAKKLNVQLIDIRTPFLQNHHYEDKISKDGIHPNEAGYKLIYSTIAEQYRQIHSTPGAIAT
jgi:lysophospholipase L1-like esterase